MSNWFSEKVILPCLANEVWRELGCGIPDLPGVQQSIGKLMYALFKDTLVEFHQRLPAQQPIGLVSASRYKLITNKILGSVHLASKDFSSGTPPQELCHRLKKVKPRVSLPDITLGLNERNVVDPTFPFATSLGKASRSIPQESFQVNEDLHVVAVQTCSAM